MKLMFPITFRKSTILFSLLLAFLWSAQSCVKTEFDEPPLGGDPITLTPNKTIAELKALYVAGSLAPLTDSIVIGGEVVMDDKSGNYYKTIVLQDASGGIEVKFNDGYLYTKFPIGRTVYINCKGLILADYNGVINLNGGTVLENNVPSTYGLTSDQVERQVFKGPFSTTPIQPKVKKINELLSSDISTLITLEDMQFLNADAGVPYADPISQITLNRTLEDCNKIQILLRTSGYANFAAINTPTNRGSVTGIYSVYRNDQQFYIRDTTDVQFSKDRCGVIGTTPITTVQGLKDAFGTGGTVIPQNSKITGIVISDKDFNNTDARNIVLQDGAAGIVVRFAAAHSFAKGDQVEVNISGLEMSEYNGLLQMTAPNDKATKVGTGTVTPRVTTAAEVKANSEAWESTLVHIKNTMFDQTGTYSGSKNLIDNTGDIVLYTRPAATFSGSALPTGTIEVIAIVSQFNAVQLQLRNTTDVIGGTPGGGGGTGGTGLLTEAFDGATNNQAIAINGWTNIAVKGTRTWLGKTFQTEKYAQATSFNSTDAEDDMWLITPGLDLSTQKSLSFQTAKSFYKHDGLTVLFSSDFNGTNLGTATWLPLTATLAGVNDADNAWVNSGSISLPITTKGYIAFRYVGTAAANTTTFRVDNIKVD